MSRRCSSRTRCTLVKFSQRGVEPSASGDHHMVRSHGTAWVQNHGRAGRIHGHAAVMPRFVRPGSGLLHGYPAWAGWRAAPICLCSALRGAT